VKQTFEMFELFENIENLSSAMLVLVEIVDLKERTLEVKVNSEMLEVSESAGLKNC
jgi:hypothetical protein